MLKPAINQSKSSHALYEQSPTYKKLEANNELWLLKKMPIPDSLGVLIKIAKERGDYSSTESLSRIKYRYEMKKRNYCEAFDAAQTIPNSSQVYDAAILVYAQCMRSNDYEKALIAAQSLRDPYKIKAAGEKAYEQAMKSNNFELALNVAIILNHQIKMNESANALFNYYIDCGRVLSACNIANTYILGKNADKELVRKALNEAFSIHTYLVFISEKPQADQMYFDYASKLSKDSTNLGEFATSKESGFKQVISSVPDVSIDELIDHVRANISAFQSSKKSDGLEKAEKMPSDPSVAPKNEFEISGALNSLRSAIWVYANNVGFDKDSGLGYVPERVFWHCLKNTPQYAPLVASEMGMPSEKQVLVAKEFIKSLLNFSDSARASRFDANIVLANQIAEVLNLDKKILSEAFTATLVEKEK